MPLDFGDCSHYYIPVLSLSETLPSTIKNLAMKKLNETTGVCPGIRMGGGPKSESLFFCFSIFHGGGPSSEIAEKMTFSTKKK